MTTVLWNLVFFGGALALFYSRASLKFVTIMCATFLFAYSLEGGTNKLWALFLWLVFFCIAYPLNKDEIRKRWFTAKALKRFRKIMPQMSRTEREALEAGTVYWDAELLSGRPNWNRLLTTPPVRLTEEEQAFLDGPVEQLCKMLNQWQISQDNDLPKAVWDFMAKERFFGMIIPKKHGGLEFSAFAQSEVLQKIASVSGDAAVTVGVPNSLGPGELLLHYGTQAQQDYYLPRLAAGTDIPCFALTAPTAGSDAAAIPDVGIVCKGQWQGEEILGMRLNWNKRYISLAPVATLLGLAFRLQDPDGLLGETQDYGITCALIPTELQGVDTSKRHQPLSMAFQNGPTRGQDVFVPLDMIIGGVERAGQGWHMLMDCLSAGRAITLPTSAVAQLKTATFATSAYARIRKQFGQSIGDFEGVGEKLAQLASLTYTIDAARHFTCATIHLGEKPAIASAIMKYHATEAARTGVNAAMDIHGGKGIMMGPNNYLAASFQATPVAITVEGANILTRSLIIFGQGITRCHPYVQAELAAAQIEDQHEAIDAFDHALFGHAGLVISNASRSLLLGLSNGRVTSPPTEGPTHQYFRNVTRYSAALGLCSDIAMASLGGQLKFREAITGRLADVLSQLYLISAVLKRYHDNGAADNELALVHYSCQQASYEIETQLQGVLDNLPNRKVARLLQCLVFPLGKRQKPPTDATSRQIVERLLVPGELREKLTAGVFSSEGGSSPLAALNAAMQMVAAAEPVERRVTMARRNGTLQSSTTAEQIQEAVDIELISAEEAKLLSQAEQAAERIIQVDEFTATAPPANKPAPKRARRKAPVKTTRKSASNKAKSTD